jgi:hypothetical protein
MYTGGRFAPSVVDTGGKLPPVTLTPAANLSLCDRKTKVKLYRGRLGGHLRSRLFTNIELADARPGISLQS